LIVIVRGVAEVVTLADGSKLSVTQFLTYFLFPPPMQQQFGYKLSGGELRRLYLVTVLMKNPNFLILDEPTNNLDIMTLQVLENYLASFPGCVLAVSHDRFFLDKISDHIFVFKGKGIIKDYPGNYSDYYDLKKEEERLEKAAAKKATVKKEEPVTIRNDYSARLSYKEKREKETLEKELEQLNAEKHETENTLNSGTVPPHELASKSKRLSEIFKLIDEKELRWLELSEKSE